jgi:hypothetical protein
MVLRFSAFVNSGPGRGVTSSLFTVERGISLDTEERVNMDIHDLQDSFKGKRVTLFILCILSIDVRLSSGTLGHVSTFYHSAGRHF